MIQTPSTVIENVEQLKAYLQAAIQLEHAVIPPYLTAAYSAKIEANRDSINIIRAVAKEEMLHLALAANLLNAIGGQPNLISPDFVPRYPTHLPTGQDDFDVGIEKFSDQALEIFLGIERPASLKPEHSEIVQYINKTVPISGRDVDESILKKDNLMVPITKVGDDKYELHYNIAVVPHNHLTAKRKKISEAGDSIVPRVPTKSSAENPVELHYWSIGEFYKAIHLGFVELAHKIGMKALFIGDPKRQVNPAYYYSAGGELVVVTDLKSALAAIDLIAGQGEGSNNRVYDNERELAHYYRFDQIRKRQYYLDPNKDGAGDEPEHPQGGTFSVDMDAVFPIKANAKVADYHGSPELEEHALLFNGQYKRFLEKLNAAFNGHPELFGEDLREEMFRIKTALERLIHNPIADTDENAAPTFEMDKFKYPPAAPTSEPASPIVTPVPGHADPFENFLLLSVQLCGLSNFDLLGTGYARRYFETVEGIIGRDLLHRLLVAFAALRAAPAHGALQSAILNHPEFGPIARNIIKLWYTATWFQLPPTWRENFGARPKDRTFVPYPYAYPESLLGPAVGAHPAGAKPTGHQSWTLPPPVCLAIPPECV
jgi:hypothetical protein